GFAMVPERDDASRHRDESDLLELVLSHLAIAAGGGAAPAGGGKTRAAGRDAARPPRPHPLQPPPAGAGCVRAGARGRGVGAEADLPEVRKASMKGSISPSITASTLPTSTPVRWSLMI